MAALIMTPLEIRQMSAGEGEVVDVLVNSHGAVTAILPGYHQLGLLPSEFEVVQWHGDDRDGWSRDRRRGGVTVTRQPIFVECSPCGERWKAATLPVAADTLTKLARRLTCPNCGETRLIFMCDTEGPKAVTGPRDGRPVATPAVVGRKGTKKR
jgi:hypothetical protein